jgi:hypothetical protein
LAVNQTEDHRGNSGVSLLCGAAGNRATKQGRCFSVIDFASLVFTLEIVMFNFFRKPSPVEIDEIVSWLSGFNIGNSESVFDEYLAETEYEDIDKPSVRAEFVALGCFRMDVAASSHLSKEIRLKLMDTAIRLTAENFAEEGIESPIEVIEETIESRMESYSMRYNKSHGTKEKLIALCNGLTFNIENARIAPTICDPNPPIVIDGDLFGFADLTQAVSLASVMSEAGQLSWHFWPLLFKSKLPWHSADEFKVHACNTRDTLIRNIQQK